MKSPSPIRVSNFGTGKEEEPPQRRSKEESMYLRFETFAPSIIKTEQVFRKLDSSQKKERKRLEIGILRDNQRNFATKKIIDMIHD